MAKAILSGKEAEQSVGIPQGHATVQASLFLGEAGVLIHVDNTLCSTVCCVRLGRCMPVGNSETDVKFIDYAFKDLRKRQVFTHPDKIGNTSVVDHWPADDLSDSAKFMTSEMHYLRTLREKILKEGPASATPAGGGSQSTSSKAPPPSDSRPQTKPPPPQPGRSESAPPGTGPTPKTTPPKRAPPGAPNYKPAPAPPPQKVIEPEPMPYDKGFSMNAHARWVENFTVYGSGEPGADLEPIWHRDDIEEAYKAG
eukprot:1709614-Amphidinium_carterae.1